MDFSTLSRSPRSNPKTMMMNDAFEQLLEMETMFRFNVSFLIPVVGRARKQVAKWFLKEAEIRAENIFVPYMAMNLLDRYPHTTEDDCDLSIIASLFVAIRLSDVGSGIVEARDLLASYPSNTSLKEEEVHDRASKIIQTISLTCCMPFSFVDTLVTGPCAISACTLASLSIFDALLADKPASEIAVAAVSVVEESSPKDEYAPTFRRLQNIRLRCQ